MAAGSASQSAWHLLPFGMAPRCQKEKPTDKLVPVRCSLGAVFPPPPLLSFVFSTSALIFFFPFSFPPPPVVQLLPPPRARRRAAPRLRRPGRERRRRREAGPGAGPFLPPVPPVPAGGPRDGAGALRGGLGPAGPAQPLGHVPLRGAHPAPAAGLAAARRGGRGVGRGRCPCARPFPRPPPSV